MLNIVLGQSLANSAMLNIVLGQSLANSVMLNIVLGQYLANSVMLNIVLGQLYNIAVIGPFCLTLRGRMSEGWGCRRGNHARV